MNLRVIPRLDIKGPNLVKGVQLEGLRVMGKPEDYARHYYQTGADELFYQDIVASLYGRNSLLPIIEQTAREIFIPLTVGGGLRSVEDIRTVLRAGADKVALNTAAIAEPELIRQASRRFGSSTIVLSIEAMRHPHGGYEAYTDNGRIRTGLEPVAWAIRGAELGAGEIMVTAINREGTGRGFDLELTRAIAQAVPIPVIACGGAGRLEHLSDVVRQGRADAVCLASMLHYGFIKEHLQDPSQFQQGNLDFLRSGAGYERVDTATLPEIKDHLAASALPCRRENPAAQACEYSHA